MAAEHIVLLGDSVFDNKSYVGSDPDVIGHLRAKLPNGWKATLLAVDGSTTAEIRTQLARMPRDATYVVVSVGGNNLLHERHTFNEGQVSGQQILETLAAAASDFHKKYAAAVEMLAELRKPTCLCTIYDGNLRPPETIMARAVVAMFDDKIYMEANRNHMSVLELRRVCTSSEDYANPIEPSGKGGEKIAAAIVAHVLRRQKVLEKMTA
jgi:hypothetical protein